MTTIRNNAITASANPQRSTPSEGLGHADASATTFAALLQQHVGADNAGNKAAVLLNASKSSSQAAASQHQRERAEPAAHADQVVQPERVRERAHEADRSANKAASGTTRSTTTSTTTGTNTSTTNNPSANKTSKAADKPAKAERASGQADSSKVDDAEAADAKSDSLSTASTSSTDPLAAWLAVLHGGASTPGAADGAALSGDQAPANALTRAQGEPLLQATDAQERLVADAGGARPLKADDANGFAAMLAGQGRGADAADGNTLGLAAVRMLASGGDAATLQNLGQPASLAAESASGLGTGNALAPDATLQAAALNSVNGAGPALARGHDTPTVAAPVGSPAFAGELADQVQVLVSKASLDAAAAGVHEARLNLNPAEMGPISIRIALDGNQAQIDFAAASGATRQALEDSMPALASALHGAGLTLSGGGVSQEFAQARQNQAEPSAANGARASQAGGADAEDGAVQDITSTVASWVRRPEGKLDLYA